MQPNSSTQGFSLIELLVTIAIVAILAAIALPNFGSTIASTRNTDLANTLYRDLKTAQAEAIRRGVSVGVYAVGTPGTWVGGWVIAPDAGGSPQGTPIASRPPVDSNYLVTASGSATSVVFTPMGNLAYLAPAVTFQACQKNYSTSSTQQVDVQLSGRVAYSSVPATSTPTLTSC
jgi:prepilin-type N-terminal cleavage/methylation domain-containing protein